MTFSDLERSFQPLVPLCLETSAADITRDECSDETKSISHL